MPRLMASIATSKDEYPRRSDMSVDSASVDQEARWPCSDNVPSVARGFQKESHHRRNQPRVPAPARAKGSRRRRQSHSDRALALLPFCADCSVPTNRDSRAQGRMRRRARGGRWGWLWQRGGANVGNSAGSQGAAGGGGARGGEGGGGQGEGVDFWKGSSKKYLYRREIIRPIR